MDDWEQHFLEKSRRRFDKERDERRRARARLTITGVLLALLFIAAVVGLAVLG